MRFKREEAFRYEFGEPLPMNFTINELNGKIVNTSKGKALMLDLSLHGMKIVTSLSIPYVKGDDVKVIIKFLLNNHNYTVRGNLVWKKQRFADYYYGVTFTADPDVQEGILEDLKLLGKRKVETL